MLNENDKTIVRLGAYIVALETKLTETDAQIKALQKVADGKKNGENK
jgi:hypothetical protein